MNHQQLVDELAALVAVEHALVVDNLQISYALGTDRDDVETPMGPASPQGREAAGVAQSSAINDMRHLKSLYRLLGTVGGRAGLGRATEVQPASSWAVPLGSVTAATFTAFEARQRAIAEAVDRRLLALVAALPAVDPPLPADVRDRLEADLTFVADHAGTVEALVSPIRQPSPQSHVRATRAEPATDAERSLVAVSDRTYRALVAMVEGWLSHDELLFDLSGRAQSAMNELDDLNALLVGRGLVPPLRP
ncbi:MAG: hypothetical protein ACLGI2_08225 [Acidimicrobiia bacterium]